MPKQRPQQQRKLLHSHPTSVVEFSDNLTHLAKHEQIHRLQMQHHRRVAQMHADQAKVMRKISTTNEIAKRHQAHEDRLAQRHTHAAGLHERELIRVRQLRDRQQFGLRRIQARRGDKKFRRRVHAKDEGKLGNISRNQLGTRFATNLVMDYNRNQPRFTPENLPDGSPEYHSLRQLRKLNKRLRARSDQPEVVNYLARKTFRVGTMTNLSPSGMYADPKQFGFPRSTI